jgi:Tol biopolymer transport system component
VSDRDLIPGGPNNFDDRFELFVFDTTSASLTQFTTPTLRSISSSASIDATGTRIAFASNRDLKPGSPGNLDGNDEIFLLDTATGSSTQITHTTFGSNRRPAISGTGTRIVFQSDRDLTPGSPGNADGDLEVFLFDTTSGTTTQLTTSPGGGGINTGPSINATGTRIAFDSSRDLTPGSPGNADGNREIFLFDTTSGTTTQVTNGTGNFTIRPSISASGTRIAFQSELDLKPGNPGNSDGNFEIFLFDTSTSTLTQITNSVGGSNGFPSINATGTRIAFVSSADLTPGSPGNSDGNFELFLASAASASAAVVLNSSQFHVGQTITYQATVVPGTTPTQADIYLGALLPDFTTFLSLVQVSPGVISVALGPAPVTFLTNVTVTSLVVPFAYTFTGAEPVGIYFPYAGITVPGSDPFQPANRLSLEVQPFQFTR